MQLVIDLPQKDIDFIAEQAKRENISKENFSRKAIMKAARNAAYVARIKQAKKNLDDGKGVYFTNEELEELFNGGIVRGRRIGAVNGMDT